VNTLRGETRADTSTAVAVTFPAQGLEVQYLRPPLVHPLANFNESLKQEPGSQVRYLDNGVPALATAANGNGWGSVEFVTGGTIITVMGPTLSEAFAQSIAQSILDRATATG
jgi:hypothetical protein